MKKLIVSLGIVIFVLTGCSEQSKVDSPPWNKKQITQMEADEVTTVPLAIFKF